MKRERLLNELRGYRAVSTAENRMVQDAIQFIEAHETCFERANAEGHVTGSAWILDEEMDYVFLIHHVKLNRWLQPGGHCDGDPDVLAVAKKEAFEETGFDISLAHCGIFDLDIHGIPAKADVPPHLHYDVRYVFTAVRRGNTIAANREIHSGRWVRLNEVSQLCHDDAIMRMIEKTYRLKAMRDHSPESS